MCCLSATHAVAVAPIPPIKGPTVHANTGTDIQSAKGTPTFRASPNRRNEAANPAQAPFPSRSHT